MLSLDFLYGLCRQIQAICKYCCCQEGNAEAFYGTHSRKKLPLEQTSVLFLLDSIEQQDSNKELRFKNWSQSLSISSSQFLQDTDIKQLPYYHPNIRKKNSLEQSPTGTWESSHHWGFSRCDWTGYCKTSLRFLFPGKPGPDDLLRFLLSWAILWFYDT